jgi:HSP20 family protein
MNLLARFGGRMWDPWREIGQLQHEMNRLLAGARPTSGLTPREYPPANLFVKEHDLVLTLEIPGIDPQSVDLTVTGDSLTIRGERPADQAKPGDNFHRRERPCGKFERTIELPFEVDPNRTEASYVRGTLCIHMCRPESHKPKRVAVKIG